MTLNEEKILKAYIYEAAKKASKKAVNDDKDEKPKKKGKFVPKAKKGQHKSKLSTQVNKRVEQGVKKWLDNKMVNHAKVAYDLFGSKKSEYDTARSLFSKKYRNAVDDDGYTNKFTPKELVKLNRIKADQSA